MKCPNCGSEMAEGSLYCEKCGEDIHIVPDFEPELEHNMEQTIHTILAGLEEEKANVQRQKSTQKQKGRKRPGKPKKRHGKKILLGAAGVRTVLICGWYGRSDLQLLFC